MPDMGRGNFVEMPRKERKLFKMMLKAHSFFEFQQVRVATKDGGIIEGRPKRLGARNFMASQKLFFGINGFSCNQRDVTHILCPYTKKWISRYKGEK